MSDQNDHKSNRPLSEISHLFLTSLREQAGENRSKPVRLPPGAPRPATPTSSNSHNAIDLTPEEFAQVYGKAVEPSDAPRQMPAKAQPNDSMRVHPSTDASIDAGDVTDVQRKRVTAIVGAHLNGQLHESVLAYAASLSAGGVRVGLLTLDASEFKLQLVDCEESNATDEAEVNDAFDARRMSDSILELNHDVDRWLLVLADPRRAESRQLMRQVDDWTLLSTCDHDGIVSGYRTLKGLAEGEKMPLSIALVDAPSDIQAEKVFSKLASVCRQFLDWDVEHDVLMADVEHAQVHTILWSHAHRDKGQLANAPQWRVVQAFLELAPDADANAAHYGDAGEGADEREEAFDHSPAVANQPLSIPTIAKPMTQAVPNQPTMAHANASVEAQDMMEVPTVKMPTAFPPTTFPAVSNQPAAMFNTDASMSIGDDSEVIDLPDGASILAAVLKSGTQLLATPINPPMCTGATVAVGRDRGLVLVAQAGTGLEGMESIAAAVAWLDASKQLIAMAMPQLSIDASLPTRVQLLIDHSDRTAEGIRPLLGNSLITIRSYRKLRWAGRTGLLLDAA